MREAPAGDWLAERARRTPERPALVAGGARLSWAELDALADTLAAALADRGVRPGSRLAAWLHPSPTAVALVHAALRRGARFTPLNTRLTAPEIACLLDHLRPDLLVHDVPEVPGGPRPGAVPLAELTQAPGRSGRPGPRRLPEEALVVYTSGTTGAPKGVRLTRTNLFWNAVASAEILGHLPDDRWLLVLPLFHVGGLTILFRALLFGAAVELVPGFDEERVAEILEAGAVTLASLVPTMLRRLMDRGARPGRLRAVLLGGGPIPPDLLAEAWEAGWPVLPTYGLTETTSQVATLPPEARGRRGVVGRPLLGTRIAVRRADGSVLPPGVPGEITVAGPTVFAGYLDDDEATRATLRQGWLHTGDVGVLDEDGFLAVLDRRRDLVVTGGENVSPSEVEAALLSHPQVADAGVYGVPDPLWGQRVVAAVVPRGEPPTPAELTAFLSARLAAYKIPKEIRFVARLPRTASGKLQRHRLPDGR